MVTLSAKIIYLSNDTKIDGQTSKNGFRMADKKSIILDVFVKILFKKLWHKNNIKREYPGHFSNFFAKMGTSILE